MKFLILLVLASSTFTFLITPQMAKKMKQAKALKQQQLLEQGASFKGYCLSGSENYVTITSITPQSPIKPGKVINVDVKAEIVKGFSLPGAQIEFFMNNIQILKTYEAVGETVTPQKIDNTFPLDLREVPFLPSGNYELRITFMDSSMNGFWCGNFQATL